MVAAHREVDKSELLQMAGRVKGMSIFLRDGIDGEQIILVLETEFEIAN